MTVAELVDRLSRMPQTATVKVLLSEVWGVMREKDGSYAINDEQSMPLDWTDAAEADIVTWEGSYVLIESK